MSLVRVLACALVCREPERGGVPPRRAAACRVAGAPPPRTCAGMTISQDDYKPGEKAILFSPTTQRLPFAAMNI